MFFHAVQVKKDICKMQKMIYTIGHSTHSMQYFLELLTIYAVNCVVDVRSLPASRFNPQFNKKALEACLGNNGIDYLHLPDAFGARQNRKDVLNEKGIVDFEKLRLTDTFQMSLSTLDGLSGEGKICALMCAEAEPLSCHRFSMITPVLKERGWDIYHIMKDKQVTSQEQLERDLLTEFAASLNYDLFDPHSPDEGSLQRAFKLKNEEIGYRPPK